MVGGVGGAKAEPFLLRPSRAAGPAHLWSRNMTGTPGAAATEDGEAPQLSPPCSPSYDLARKVGGHCVQRWGTPVRVPRATPPRAL